VADFDVGLLIQKYLLDLLTGQAVALNANMPVIPVSVVLVVLNYDELMQ
jgi:hypothetical protein